MLDSSPGVRGQPQAEQGLGSSGVGRGGQKQENPQPSSLSPWQQDALGLHSGMEQRLLGVGTRPGLRAGLQGSGVQEAEAGGQGRREEGCHLGPLGIQGMSEKSAGPGLCRDPFSARLWGVSGPQSLRGSGG